MSAERIVFGRPYIPESSTALNLYWLVRLRWVALAAQLFVLFSVRVVFQIPFSTPALSWLLLVGAASNLGLYYRSRRGGEAHALVVAAVIALDIALLTILLTLSGGPMNPFSVFYVVHVALGALLLDLRFTAALTLLTSLSFGALFVFTPEAGMHALHHGDGFMNHLYGMWVSYSLVSLVVGVFVSRIARSLSTRERELSNLRDLSARNEKLASLSTLAAGAAHELGSPLATIAVIANELRRASAGELDARAVAEDAELLTQETERCRGILRKLAGDAGLSRAEAPRRIELPELGDLVAETLSPARRSGFHLHTPDRENVMIPVGPWCQIVHNLVANAFDAQEPSLKQDSASVSLELSVDSTQIKAVVRDRGAGMSPTDLRRLGEPFFTTKAPGAGLGLGFFLARTFAERFRGEIQVDSEVGLGTTVTLWLPREF
jgi:two-component system, sensor histidine kinase RegB